LRGGDWAFSFYEDPNDEAVFNGTVTATDVGITISIPKTVIDIPDDEFQIFFFSTFTRK